MEIKGNHNPLGMQIEGKIRKTYRDAFNILKQVNSYQAALESIANMFDALGKSRPDKGRGIEWARDVIPAYRNLGNVIKQISQSNLSMGEDWEYLENLGELLEEYGNDTADKLEELEEVLQIKNILYNYKIKKDEIEELSKIKKVLEKYGIEYADELDKSLGNEENLQNKLENLEDNFG